jgi:hypothetical protein
LYGGFDATESYREDRDWTTNPTTIQAENDWLSSVRGEDLTDLILDGFTVTGGSSSSGIYLENSAGQISHCIIAQSGSYGLYVSGGTSLTVADCTMTDNTSGGLCASSCTNLLVQDCTIKNNHGSGIDVTQCDSTITDSIISGNGVQDGTPVDNGGGVSCGLGSITLTNNRIIGNVAGNFGGGVYAYGIAPLISHNIIIGNRVVPRPYGDDMWSEGGGIALKECIPGGAIDGNLFAHNTVGDHGGAITYEGTDTTTPITNNVFIHNRVLGNEFEGGDPKGGGAINILNSAPAIANDTFLFNEILVTPDCGGGAVLQPSGSTVVNCIFMGNKSPGGKAGAICGGDVSYSDFYQNSAPDFTNLSSEHDDKTSDPTLTDPHYVVQLENRSSYDGLTIEPSQDPAGRAVDYDICNIANNAWVFLSDVEVPDTECQGQVACHLGVRYILPSGTVTMNLFVDNETEPREAINLDSTSGWETRDWADLGDIELPSGSHSLKVTFTGVGSGENLRLNWMWLDYCPLLNAHLCVDSPCIDTGRDSLGSPNVIPSTDYDDDERPVDGATDMGADEWKYTLCGTAANVQARAAGDPVYVNGWEVASVTPHWLGTSEFVLQDSSEQPVTILWSGSPPVVGETLGVGGKVEIENGIRRINALTLWRTKP